MSHWINISRDNITFDKSQNEIDILYKVDYSGNCYLCVKVKDIIGILKENNLLKG